MSKFRSSTRPGFSMTFENGWTISVQWHLGAYCDRKSLSIEPDNNPAESTTAEIAIWDTQGKWYNFGSDEVLGYQTADQVAKWMEVTKSFKPIK